MEGHDALLPSGNEPCPYQVWVTCCCERIKLLDFRIPLDLANMGVRASMSVVCSIMQPGPFS